MAQFSAALAACPTQVMWQCGCWSKLCNHWFAHRVAPPLQAKAYGQCVVGTMDAVKQGACAAEFAALAACMRTAVRAGSVDEPGGNAAHPIGPDAAEMSAVIYLNYN